MSEALIYVHIGEAKVGRGDDVLHALLGSCVGIALLYPNKEVYGLAHCLLPESPKAVLDIGARYVDQAIQSLLILMGIKKAQYGEVQAVIAGGGNMTKPETAKEEDLIGTINVNKAIECLKALGIAIIYKDVGGITGRKISLYCASEKYEINSISRNRS
jgi:chemotaxis protein CheD